MRRKGSRNAGFDVRRAELLKRLKLRLNAQDRPTLRELAAAADSSVSTLRHYFGRRQDILLALFDDTHHRALPRLARVSDGPPGFEASVHAAVSEAWEILTRRGAARTLMMGMVEGLGDSRIAPQYLGKMFDPFIRALMERLARHVAEGEMRDTDTRMAALSLVSPLLLAAVHQNELGGREVWPLDGAAFQRHVAEAFVQAYRRA